jgi:hypothetical protein
MCTGILLETSVIFPAAPKFTSVEARVYSILKTTSFGLEYSCMLFRYLKSVEEHLKVLCEHLIGTSSYIQPVRELLAASGRMGVAVQNS